MVRKPTNYFSARPASRTVARMAPLGRSFSQTELGAGTGRPQSSGPGYGMGSGSGVAGAGPAATKASHFYTSLVKGRM